MDSGRGKWVEKQAVIDLLRRTFHSARCSKENIEGGPSLGNTRIPNPYDVMK